MMWMDVIVYDGKVWVLAGRKSDEPGAAGDSAGAWHSADDGKTWTKNFQTIEAHRIGPARSMEPIARARKRSSQ